MCRMEAGSPTPISKLRHKTGFERPGPPLPRPWGCSCVLGAQPRGWPPGGRRPPTGGLPSRYLRRPGSNFPSQGTRRPEIPPVGPLAAGSQPPPSPFVACGGVAWRQSPRLGENVRGARGARRPRAWPGRLFQAEALGAGPLEGPGLRGGSRPGSPGSRRGRPHGHRASCSGRRRAGCRAGCHPRHAVPGRGARREAEGQGTGPKRGCCGGAFSRGPRGQPPPLPRPPHLAFPSAETSRTKGVREGPAEEPAPRLTKAAASDEGGRWGRGGGGAGDTPGAPIPEETDPARH